MSDGRSARRGAPRSPTRRASAAEITHDFGKPTGLYGHPCGRGIVQRHDGGGLARSAVIRCGSTSIRSYVGQRRHGLTNWVNPVRGYIRTRSEAQGANDAESDATAVGAILFV